MNEELLREINEENYKKAKETLRCGNDIIYFMGKYIFHPNFNLMDHQRKVLGIINQNPGENLCFILPRQSGKTKMLAALALQKSKPFNKVALISHHNILKDEVEKMCEFIPNHLYNKDNIDFSSYLSINFGVDYTHIMLDEFCLYDNNLSRVLINSFPDAIKIIMTSPREKYVRNTNLYTTLYKIFKNEYGFKSFHIDVPKDSDFREEYKERLGESLYLREYEATFI